MKRASITETKNHLSRLLDEVRQGATILIMDRNKPVARLEPAAGGELASGDRIAVLVREGLAAAPRQRFGAAAFLARQPARLPDGVSAVDTLLAERSETR